MSGIENGKINAKTTAYATLCGGTSNPGIIQSISSLGTSGQVLTSNGAGLLPSMQDSPIIGEWTTFSPSIRGSTTAGTPSYFLLSGKYLLVGTTCFVAGYINYTAISGEAGNPAIGNLPFTIKNSANNNIPFSVQSESWGSNDPASAVTSINSNFAVLYANNGSISSFDQSAALTFSGFYEVA